MEEVTIKSAYAIETKCVNCGNEEKILIPHGVSVEETRCSTCQCLRLTATWKDKEREERSKQMKEIIREAREEKINLSNLTFIEEDVSK